MNCYSRIIVDRVAIWLTTLCLLTALPARVSSGQQHDLPGFIPHADQLEIFQQGVAAAASFREDLLAGDKYGDSGAAQIGRSIRRFTMAAHPRLRDHRRPGVDGFFVLPDVVATHLSGVDEVPDAFSTFSGKWFGVWDSNLVDHDWQQPVVYDLPIPLVDPLRICRGQYAWIGDGFGWNVECSLTPGKKFILGSVYHVKNGDRHQIRLHRPHVGIAISEHRLIWITPRSFYLEEVLLEDPAHERYAITGCDYQRSGDGITLAESAFQAIYSRNGERVPFFRFRVEQELEN